MTIEEAYQQYGYLVYEASEGDSLLWVCRQLYGSDASYYRRVLRVLNPGVNWLCLSVGQRIEYLSSDVVSANELF